MKRVRVVWTDPRGAELERVLARLRHRDWLRRTLRRRRARRQAWAARNRPAPYPERRERYLRETGRIA